MHIKRLRDNVYTEVTRYPMSMNKNTIKIQIIQLLYKRLLKRASIKQTTPFISKDLLHINPNKVWSIRWYIFEVQKRYSSEPYLIFGALYVAISVVIFLDLITLALSLNQTILAYLWFILQALNTIVILKYCIVIGSLDQDLLQLWRFGYVCRRGKYLGNGVRGVIEMGITNKRAHLVSSIPKRFFSFFLAMLISATSFPMIAKADDSYVGGGTGGQGFESGTWRANWNSNQIGVRMSIVNQEGELVLKDATTGAPYVVDILFSQPTGLNTSQLLYMKGNKFQPANGEEGQEVTVISNWVFNEWINNAIKSNPELQNKLSLLKEGSGAGYEGLPLPIIYNNGTWIGNGSAVKEFFIRGSIGSYNPGSEGPSYDADDLYTPSTPSGNSSTVSGSGASSTQGNSQLVMTPYGRVTKDWLNKHMLEVQNNSLSQFANSGYITSSERAKILSNAKAVRDNMICTPPALSNSYYK